MTNSQEQIGMEQLGLGAVLKRYRLHVPTNQRDYAWSDKEVTSLLEDLSYAMINDENQHFFGTLVTIPRDDGILEVVDGQQRLATTAIVLAVMRHIVLQNVGNLASALEPFLTSVDNTTLELAPKLSLNTADTAVFHALIIDGDASAIIQQNRESHQLLKKAYLIVQEFMNNVSKTVSGIDKTKIFQNWMNFIEYKAKVILLVVPNNSNAYKMFETLNDRGLRVSQSDLVKNHIFGESKGRLTEAQNIWSQLKGSLESLGEEDIIINFLRQAIISLHGPTRQSELYEKVQSLTKGTSASILFITTLELIAQDYVSLASPSSQKWNKYPAKVRKSLSVLNLFDIKAFLPLLMAIAKEFTPKETSEAFERIISFGVRIIIASSTRSGSIEQQCGKTAKLITDKIITNANEMQENMKMIVPNDDQFQSSFEIATVSQAKFARYYLRSLEMVAQNEPYPYFIPTDDPDAINLEHILPLKPLSDWPNFSQDEVRTYSRRIGNMTLLEAKSNSQLQSSNFEVKKKAFKGSPYITTDKISNEATWGVQQILARQKYLAELALKAWPHQG